MFNTKKINKKQIQENRFKKNRLSEVIFALATTTVVAGPSLAFAQDGAAEVAQDKPVQQQSASDSTEDSSPAYEGTLEEVTVSGVRYNLQNAQDIKRNADTFVDSISSEDMGSLPDRSVLEAMQRMPGVSIERFAGADDPDHFGVEGSGAVIRGMTATRSEFNGRDSFTANSGRGLSFQDVPPELMGGVDVYKNQSADMIEGGIGGTVSLRTRKPFDSPEQTFSVSADYSQGDLDENGTPSLSALYSDRWMTEAGEFGVLFNVAHSELQGTSHGIQSDTYLNFDAEGIAGAENFDSVWLPNASNFFQKRDDRTRKGYAGAFQWANTDETILATAQFMRSDSRLSWTENAVKYQGDSYDAARTVGPLAGTEFSFDDDGVFEQGAMVTEAGWRGGYAPGDGQYGSKFQTDTRVKDTHTVVDDVAFNLQLTPNENWEYSFDLQYIQAETQDDDLQIAMGQWMSQTYDASGDTPTLVVGDPNQPYDGSSDPNWFRDPQNYWWRSAMDHFERSEGESVAGRFDGTYYFSEEPLGLLRAAKFGARLAQRDQTVRITSYNWGPIGAEWNTPYYLNDPEVADQPYEYVNFSDFHRGGVVSVPGGGFLFPDADYVKGVLKGNRDLFISPDGDPWEPYRTREDIIAKGIFQAPEVFDTTETNRAAYVRLDFGSDETALRFSGNVGLRYVELEREALGSVQYPDFVGVPYPDGAPVVLNDYDAVEEWATQAVVDGRFATAREAMAYARDPSNWLTPEEKAFGNDAFSAEEAWSKYSSVLPSFNLKLELREDLLARFAVSKAIALPDMSEVKNQAVIGARQLGVVREDGPVEPPADGEETEDNGTNIVSVAPVDWTGSGGNPYLWPMESIQYDASVEWYFADVGSFTTSAFYKDLSDTFIKGAFPRDFANPLTGQVQTVDFESTINGGDGFMQGVELAYQQFYDFLPAPFDGVGLQLNYTWIDSGLSNSGVEGAAEPTTGEEQAFDRYPLPDISLLPLRGVSEHTFNVVGMYEKGPWSARLAYNWRSKYLLTTRDTISKYPIFNDDAGYMDGSIFYNFDNGVTVGLQASNLLDTQTETIMQLDNQGTEARRSWFIQDRRYALIVRANF
ncbi:TonB-dependent receptor [Microbulbifer sp. YPW1]|uniref:TonB-dependent receptor n=1 Tax=Microbulbifer sp. YPW1 TaxID=2745199 RepID=UPI001597698A|nr:TonB-dependent receptor [Microbulbifer sp. YPW1]QKX17225.1 TonB-dependent receptor [Microbulbifer sp. YPW1]